MQYLESGIHGLDWAKRLTIAFNLNFSRLLEWKTSVRDVFSPRCLRREETAELQAKPAAKS